MKKFLWVLVVLCVVMLIAVSPVLAAATGADAQEVPELLDALKLLANGVGVGAVIAFMFERLAWFQAMSEKTKWWVVLGISLCLPMLAQLVIQFVTPDVLVILEPYWRTIATGFLVWAGSQGVHAAHNYLVNRTY